MIVNPEVTYKLFTMLYQRLTWIIEEIKILTALALPPSIICLTEALQLKLSYIFIGRVSGENVSSMLSALFIGQVVTICTAYSISEGLSACVNILCSQAYGKKQYRLVGLYYYRVLLLMVLICFPLFSLFISVGPIVHFFTQDMELSLGAGRYTSIYCFGFPAYAYYYISVRFLQSHNVVLCPLFYLIIGSIVNGILQYILILHYNFGIAGAAAAYVISIYLIALLVFTHIRFSRVHISTAVEFNIELISGWLHTAKYAFPTILQTFIGFFVSNVFPIIILLLVCNNKKQLAIYSILYSVCFVYALFTMGFTSSLTVRVGHLLGANDTQKAKRSAIFGIVFGELVFLVISIGTIILSHPLSQLFTTDPSFANEVYHNLLILPVITLSDIMLLGQGVANACRMQHVQAGFKFIYMFVLGFVAEYFLVKLFAWKALSIFAIQGLAKLLCLISSMAVIFTRNWETFSLKIRDSNQLSSNTQVIEDDITSPKPFFLRIGRSFCNSYSFILTRYIICFVLGCFIFTAAYLLN